MIVDTDASFAVDDVVAICLAHSLANKGMEWKRLWIIQQEKFNKYFHFLLISYNSGEVDIRAIVHNTGIPEAIGAVSVLNHYFGRDDILLGSYKVQILWEGHKNLPLLSNFKFKWKKLQILVAVS